MSEADTDADHDPQPTAEFQVSRNNKCWIAFKVLLIAGIVITITALFLLFIVYPEAADKFFKKNVTLSEGTLFYDRWKDTPPFVFKVYFFNVTNPDDVLLGAKPVIKEIGPYVYAHSNHKLNITSPTPTTYRYREKMLTIFNASASKDLQETDLITILDFSLMGLILTAQGVASDQMDRFKMVIDKIFPDRTTPFITGQVKDILFNGIPLDCSARNFLVHLFCRQLTKWSPSNYWLDENRVYKFAFLYEMNRTTDIWYAVNRGIKDLSLRGMMTEYQNETTTNIWHSKYCNMLNGTPDGSCWPLLLTKETPLSYFLFAVVRTFHVEYARTQYYRDIQVYRYEIKKDVFGSVEEFPENECYCARGMPETENSSTPLLCSPEGLFNIIEVVKAPLIVSWPWFLFANESLVQDVFGGPSNHSYEDIVSYAEVEPSIGLPIKGARRFQYNIEIKPDQSFPYLKKVRQTIVPTLWMDLSFTIPNEDYLMARQLLGLLSITKYCVYMILGLGIGCLAAACILFIYLKKAQIINYTTKIKPNDGSGKIMSLKMTDKSNVWTNDGTTANTGNYKSADVDLQASNYTSTYQNHFM